VGTTFGQLPGTSGNISAQNQQETARLERQYEVQIKNALSDYYNEHSFLIDANIELEEVLVPNEYNRSREREEPVGVDQLPGLPILPQGFSRTVDEDTVKPERYSSALQIRQMSMRVVVDTSYSFDDIQFVEELVTSEANLDETRGDNVTVDQRAFPRGQNTLAAEEGTSQNNTQPDTSREDTLREDDQSETEEAAFFRWDNPELLRYIIYGLLGFIILLSIALFLAGRNKKEEESDVDRRQTGTDRQAFDELKQEIKNLKEDESEEEEREITPERKALFEKDRSYITNQYISHPQKVANLLEEWITSDPDEGVLKAAKAVKGGNEKLLSTLRPVLKRKHVDYLQY
jgi:hypothetical protein